MREFTRDTPDSVKKALILGATKDHFLMFDSPAELADFAEAKCSGAKEYGSGLDGFYGDHSGRECAKLARVGDLSLVERSDALLAKFERFAFDTNRRAWIDDVVGAVPNVPAFIAGHPLNMRRRKIDEDGSAPLAIVADLTSSCGMSAQQIEKRGTAILALVRILSQRRPIELWAGCMMRANPMGSCSIFAKIDTAPLDIATAAYVLTSSGFPRRLCYAIANKKYAYGGQWPYRSGAVHRPHMAEILAPAFTHTTQTLCIPAIFQKDESVTTPERWLEARLSELAPADLAA